MFQTNARSPNCSVAVHVVKDLQQGLYPLVLYHCKNGGAHGRPGVTAVMRLTGLGTASANLLPISEAPAIEPVECSMIRS